MDSAGVIPEINSTLPPVPHFSFTATASPGGGNSSANAAITNSHPSARKQLKPLAVEANGALMRNNLYSNSMGGSKLQK